MSYPLSALNSFLGLLCAVRARDAQSVRRRNWWLCLAALAIGGTAIWTIHFMAMLGFDVSGTQVRYHVPITFLSALLAVVTVGIGMAVVGFGRVNWVRIGIGGLSAGLGVAAMHYVGMSAIRLRGRIDYEPSLVMASVVIAVVAATAALWLAVTGAALVMGVAVSGMHYTGMAAMSVHPLPAGPAPAGAAASTLLLPIMLIVLFVAFVLFYALLSTPNGTEPAPTGRKASGSAPAGAPPASPTPSGGAGTSSRAGRRRTTDNPGSGSGASHRR